MKAKTIMQKLKDVPYWIKGISIGVIFGFILSIITKVNFFYNLYINYLPNKFYYIINNFEDTNFFILWLEYTLIIGGIFWLIFKIICLIRNLNKVKEKKNEKIWFKALKETFKHYSIILFLLLSYGVIIWFGDPRLIYPDLIGIIVESIFNSISYPLPVLIGVFVSYFVVYSNLQKSKKILFTILIYLFFGFSAPLALLILVGIGQYTGDTEGLIFALALVVNAFLIYSILTAGNYLFMYLRNKRYFKN